jgi:hypothetical protein
MTNARRQISAMVLANARPTVMGAAPSNTQPEDPDDGPDFLR